MKLKNIDCIWPDRIGYGNMDVLKSDIIISFGNQKTIEELIEIQLSRMKEYPWMRYNRQSFIEEETEKIKNIFNKIEKHYRIIDTFYIHDFFKQGIKSYIVR